MKSEDFLTYGELVADLQAFSREYPPPEMQPLSLSLAVGRQGQVSIQGFFVHKQRAELVLPAPPKSTNVVVGAGVTLLNRRTVDDIDLYPYSTMIILGIDDDSVDGYIFQSSPHRNCRVRVSKSQIIDCVPPLDPDQDEDELVYGELPF
jgi:hypothetical protein